VSPNERSSAHGPADDDAVLSALEAERLDLRDRLGQLGPADWSTPSLCGNWTVHDVAAHLALATRESTWDFVTGMIRSLGNFDRMTAQNAQRHAERYPPGAIINQLRATAGSAHTTFGSSPRDCLIDVVVHTQDMARPLGLDWATPPERTVIALDHALASRWYGAKQRLAGLALTATDTGWTGGTGSSPVHGPTIDLLLVATGRPSGLDRLDGPGIRSLQDRFAA